jgi:metal-responsive CopG/Arc/MetJ family transcriptional regulator
MLYTIGMALENDKQFQMRVSAEFLQKIDDWRRGQTDIPGRSEAIRRLVEQALDSPPKKKA